MMRALSPAYEPPAPLERVAIVGLGLMGTSLGLALRAGGLARVVAGYDPLPEATKRALAQGAVDEISASAAEVVAGADLVALACPIHMLAGVLAEISYHLGPTAIVTDLASTKGEVVGHAERVLSRPGRFVGGHPMTGSEHGGEAASAGLFSGQVWCLTPTERTEPEALGTVMSLVTALGASPVVMAPAPHDACVALISHLPRLTASALVLTAVQSSVWPEAVALAAGGFRDTTRVASGSAEMLLDMCLTNREEVLSSLDAYLALLQSLRARIADGDTTLARAFASAKAARDGWLVARGGAKHAQ